MVAQDQLNPLRPLRALEAVHLEAEFMTRLDVDLHTKVKTNNITTHNRAANPTLAMT